MAKSLWGLLLVFSGPLSGAQEIVLQVRDGVTGAPVQGQLQLSAPQRQDLLTLSWPSRSKLDLSAGRWRGVFSAAGYARAEFSLDVGPDALPFTLLLDPLSSSALTTQVDQLAQQWPQRMLLHGWVRRDSDGQAIAQAQIELLPLGLRVLSDGAGYFRLPPLPAGEVVPTGPQQLGLVVTALGYPDSRKRVARVAGAQTMVLTLSTAAQPDRATDHAWLDPHAVRQRAAHKLISDEGIATATLAPPSSIRVGFNDASCSQSCCRGNCSHVCVMSLESYVARGLNDEWIASWGEHALAAGSVAYRSYGAAHALKPRFQNYDICSSACCQVNDADVSQPAAKAAAGTAGIMLQRSAGAPFFAEYSAQNNSWDDPNDGLSCSNADLSCGNGQVGSPMKDWPCLVDSVAVDQGCFGHGRGMSQWGTQHWSQQGQRWPWITDHYYNDNNNATGAMGGLRQAFLSSPVEITFTQAMPASAAAGQAIELLVEANNHAGLAHELLLGASLYHPAHGFISDPPHDRLVSLAGTEAGQLLQRAFDIPISAAQANYALDVALYLDVDADGLISSADLLLAYRRQANALLLDDLVFADSFE